MATDQLTALNMMLAVIGEAPVASYSSTIPEAVQARATLANISREVQAEGLHCNTDYELPYVPDAVTHRITVGSDVIHIDPTDSSKDIVQRGTLLYDRTEKRFEFYETIYCDTIKELAFTDLPEAYRYYIAVRAARIFQQQVLGNESLERYTELDEARARAIVQNIEMRTSDHRMANYSPVYQVLRRW